jgi:acyl carrier protein
MEERKRQITAKVIELAAEQAGVNPAQVTPDSHFVNDLNYDSLDAVNLIMEVEDEFELSVPDDVAQTLDTVGKLVDYVLAHAGAGGTAQTPLLSFARRDCLGSGGKTPRLGPGRGGGII